MQKTLGYINRYLYTDVTSHEVFEEDGKIYAVSVIKKPGSVKPEFHAGGFSAYCSNQWEVWRNGVIERDGEPFEVECRNGIYGYVAECVEDCPTTPERLEETKKMLEERGYACRVIEDEFHAGYLICQYYKPTKNGKVRHHFVKLGKLEKTCNYFYDYNF